MSSVVGVAGRRIDAEGARIARFPLKSVPKVEARLERHFAAWKPHRLVSSAACGADLLALTIAERRGIRSTIVLPFAPAQFKKTSVTDRPDGRWGPMFDSVISSAEASGQLQVLNSEGDSVAAYRAVNDAIWREVMAFAEVSQATPLAVIIWEGAKRGDEDLTAEFADAARRLGVQIEVVNTL
jgi:hypothetical protein